MTPYNPLTGNRRFFLAADQAEGEGPDAAEPRTVEPPPHQGAGQTFRPANRKHGPPASPSRRRRGGKSGRPT